MFQVFKRNEGGEHYVGKVATLNEARAKILALSEYWPAEYAILDSETGIWSSFPDHRVGDNSGARPVASTRGGLPVVEH